MEFLFNNCNDAFTGLVSAIHEKTLPTVRTTSRVGDVLMVEEPVLVTYLYPTQRVLFNQERDANCFFHLYESLWMLAGCNDVAPLAYYSSKIADMASDDGKTFNGAYGFRWRNGWNGPMWAEGRGKELANCDQLRILIDHLKRKPESRRAVLQMWNVEDDLLKIDVTKDTACNTNVYFSLRNEEDYSHGRGCLHLDMTVCNRSNDLVLGMLGANVVHFSVLQEYMAAYIGVQVGKYRQFTNNLHVYVNNWEPEKWLSLYCNRDMHSPKVSAYHYDAKHLVELVCNPERFDVEVTEFVERHSKDAYAGEYEDEFLRDVAQPMMIAYHHAKRRDYDSALVTVETVAADDWRIAGTNWINKRRIAWEKRNATTKS